jgi:hypothetical protein
MKREDLYIQKHNLEKKLNTYLKNFNGYFAAAVEEAKTF